MDGACVPPTSFVLLALIASASLTSVSVAKGKKRESLKNVTQNLEFKRNQLSLIISNVIDY